MILKIADWDSTVGDHNAVATQTAMTRYVLSHQMFESASCIIYLADPDGVLFQTYDVDVAGDSVYVGSGAIELEDPDATKLLYGRIKKVRHLEEAGQTVLICTDWMDQLRDKHINYDMREDLNGLGLRESFAHGSLDDADYYLPCYTVPGNDASYLIDSNREAGLDWVENQFNTMYLVIPQSAVGRLTISVGPHSHSGAENMTANGFKNLWEDDANTDVIEDTTASLSVEYEFYVGLPMDVGPQPTTAMWDENTIESISVTLVASGVDATIAGGIGVQFEADGPFWIDCWYHTQFLADDEVHKKTVEIPAGLWGEFINDDGTVKLRVLAPEEGGQDPEVTLYYFKVDVVTTMKGSASAYLIRDTIRDPDGTGAANEYNTLEIDDDIGDDGEDLTVTGLGVWPGMPYSICKPARSHISALVLARDPLMELTFGGEVTYGVTSKHYSERTVLEIMQDIATISKAIFYMSLGTKAITWDYTLNAAGTALLDTGVIEWIGTEWDADSMFNEVHIQGQRVGDTLLYTDTGDTDYFGTDPAATSKAGFDYTRSKAISNKGAGSQFEINALAKAMVGAADDIQLFLKARIAGLDSSYRVGTEVKVTSTQLNLTNAMYIVTHWQYDSDSHETTIRMHPRNSTLGLAKHLLNIEHITHTQLEADMTQRDLSITDLHTQTWSN